MGSFKLILPLFLLLQPLLANVEYSKIIYLTHCGDVESAFNLYLSQYSQSEQHNFDLLQQLSLILLDKGLKSSSTEEQLLTIYGAGISTNEKSYYLLEAGLNSPYPQIQAVSLNFLARSQSDYADTLINRLITSPNPLIRLEAAYQLALKKHPLASPQIEALMYKMGEEVACIFPKLFATCGDATSTKVLRKLLTHPKSAVRCETILCLAEFSRDDLLPSIRKMALHSDIAQQETCAVALGILKDEASIPLLKRLASTHSASVKIAAIQALNEIKDTSLNHEMFHLAKKGNLFAIYALKDFPHSEELLSFLTRSENVQIRINASFALLKKHHPKCVKGLLEILLKDTRDIAVVKIHTYGKGVTAFKATPSAAENEENALLQELSLAFREDILKAAVDLPEKQFLEIAQALFDHKQNELIPSLCQLLQQIGTPISVDLLKKEQQKAGAPLIRNYCNLALFKLNEDGPYAKNLIQWVSQQQQNDMIRFRAFVPFDLRDAEHSFELTPEETARLLIDSFEAIAQFQEDQGINLLIDAIINGNPKNRYVLAGLLLRITQ